jgi:NitT/TauT family transport system substrate-binding protein
MGSFRRSLTLLLLGLSLSACVSLPQRAATSGGASAVTAPQVRVCTSLSSAQMNVQMAQAEELDTKYGIDLDVTVVNNAATAMAALIAGDFDLCQHAGVAAVSAIAEGADLVVIGGILNRQPYYLITRPEIKQPADLIGKALAVSGPGSSSDFAARRALESLQLRPDQDVSLLTVGGASERIAAMENGAVVGTILAPPEAMTVLAAGNNLLLDFSELDNEYQHIALITTREFLQQHPDIVDAYLKATSEAVAMMHADKPLTLEVMARYLELDPVADAEALNLTYDLVLQKQLQVEPLPSLPGIQALIDELAKENPSVAELKPADVVELSAIEKLRGEGFFQGLQAQTE